jgi:RNA polymerase sigma-70 factor (ECF subfamily)
MGVLAFIAVTDATDDIALVAAAIRGGSEGRRAERTMCDRYAGRVRRFAEHHLRDAQLAADVTQEVFLVVIDAMRRGRIEQPERLGAFVLATCRHLVWDENRGEGRRRRPLPEIAPDAVELPAVTEVDRFRLERCVMALAEREMGIVVLTYIEDWSPERIATAFGTTTGNVRVIRHRAMTRLRACLEGA